MRGIKRKRLTREGIIQPSGGSRKYKSLELENGLSVLLISDASVSQAAASMAVRVGSIHDPPEIQGLSHFLEHMVFRGSAVSDDNELKNFLAMHDGEANGHTEIEHSIFHMLVDTDDLKPALRRFSHLFTEPPLMRTKAMKSEIIAVDSEFEAVRATDKCRLDQLRGHTSRLINQLQNSRLAQLGFQTVPIRQHPFTKFSWGNEKSLSSIGTSALRTSALNFFSKHYIGASMKLVVLGKENVNKLGKWVARFFHGLKHGSESSSKFSIPRCIWNTDSLFLLEAAEDQHLLEVSWIIPPKSSELFLNRPELYLVQVLSHECQGSLCSFLKSKGWATSLTVTAGNTGDVDDCVYGSTSVGRLFIISIELTNRGLEEKYEVVAYIYQYLKLVRDEPVPGHVMSEYRQLKEIEFECLDNDEGDLSLFTQKLAANMLDYPVKHVVSGNYLNHICTPKLIGELLEHLSPKNMRIDLVSKSFNAQEVQNEPWFNSSYIEEHIPFSHKEKWINTTEVDAHFRLPPENRFLPTSFLTRSNHEDEVNKVVLLLDKPSVSLLHKYEETLPALNFCVYLNAVDDIKNHLMMHLFHNLVVDSLSETFYQGKEALLSGSLSLSDFNRVVFKVNGYRERLFDFLSEIWNQFLVFLPTLERFEISKEDCASTLVETILDLEEHSDQILSEVTTKVSYSIDEKLNALKNISLDELINFIHILRSKMYIEGIFFGDLLMEEANKISSIFAVSPDTLPECRRNIERVRLPSGTIIKQATVRNMFQTNSLARIANSLARVFFQIENNHRNVGLLTLFNAMIEEKLIQQLRTEEGLGYDVGCNAEFVGGISFSVTVISARYNPTFLVDRINHFIEKCRDLLGVDERTLKKYKKCVRTQLAVESGEDIWKQIEEKRFVPGSDIQVRDEVKGMKQEDLMEFHEKFFTESSPECRKVVICIY